MNYSIPNRKEVSVYSYGQIMFDTLDEAIAKANKVSADLLYSVSVRKRQVGKDKGKFVINRLYADDHICHDQHKMLVTNYEANFTIFSNSPSSGQHCEGFATEERSNGYYKKLVSEKYRTNIRKEYPIN